MNHIKQALSMMLMLSILVIAFSSCSNSNEPQEPEQTTLSEAQAEALFEDNELFFARLTGFLMSDMVETTSGDLSDLYDLGGITTSGSSGLMKSGNLSRFLNSILSDTVYYKGSGCWALEFAETEEFLSANVTGEVCFGSVNEMGYPVLTNDVMDFLLNGTIATSYSGDTFNETGTFNILKDINLVGINGFNAGTGMISANGEHSEEVIINYTSDEGSFNSIFKISFTIKDFDIEKESIYPAGGGYQFQISIKATETGSEPIDFLINGDVTFDGSNLAAVTFNGYNFILDMSNYYGTE